MAKQKSESAKIQKADVSRPGVHSKSGTSSLKSSKNYKKLNKGQGR